MQNSDTGVTSSNLDSKLDAALKAYEAVQIELAALSAAASEIIAEEEEEEESPEYNLLHRNPHDGLSQTDLTQDSPVAWSRRPGP